MNESWITHSMKLWSSFSGKMNSHARHRRKLWGGCPGTCPPTIEKCPCIYHFLPPSGPQYFGLPTHYFLQVYAGDAGDHRLYLLPCGSGKVSDMRYDCASVFAL